MKKWGLRMKKSVFITITSILLLILCITVGYIYFYRAPYSRKINELNEVKYSIESKYNITIGSITQYNSQNIYYIAANEENIRVYNQNYELLFLETVDYINEDLVLSTLQERYGISCSKDDLELGYENKQLAYLFKSSDSNNVKYIYLNANNAEEIKFYELGK